METLESRIALSDYTYIEPPEPHAEPVRLPYAINGEPFSLLEGSLTISGMIDGTSPSQDQNRVQDNTDEYEIALFGSSEILVKASDLHGQAFVDLGLGAYNIVSGTGYETKTSLANRMVTAREHAIIRNGGFVVLQRADGLTDWTSYDFTVFERD
jgi:hypothetical protein